MCVSAVLTAAITEAEERKENWELTASNTALLTAQQNSKEM